RAADHALAVIVIEVGTIEEACGHLEHDGQAVNDKALRHQLVAYGRYRGAGIVGPIAGHIDDAAETPDAAAVEQMPRKLQCGGDGCHACTRDGYRLEAVGKGARRGGTVDGRPGYDHVLGGGAGPLKVGHGDAAMRSRGDGL